MKKKAERLTFSTKDAKRIRSAVIAHEKGDRSESLVGMRYSEDEGVIRGTFTAPWSKGSTATVTHAAMSSVTYQAKNYFGAITTTGTKACAIAWANGEWILLAAECT
jgi:hypothetical protein